MPAGPVEGQWVHVVDVPEDVLDGLGDMDVFDLPRPRDLVPRAQVVEIGDQMKLVSPGRERLFDIVGVLEILGPTPTPVFRVKVRHA